MVEHLNSKCSLNQLGKVRTAGSKGALRPKIKKVLSVVLALCIKSTQLVSTYGRWRLFDHIRGL